MKKTILITIAVLVIFTGCTAEQKIGVSKIWKAEQKIEVGQVWKYESQNPFNKFSYTATITEIKDGYVKYKQVYNWDAPDTTRTDSINIRLFKIGMTRVTP